MGTATFFRQKTDYLSFYTAMFGVKIRIFKVKESIYVGFKLIHIIEIQDG